MLVEFVDHLQCLDFKKCTTKTHFPQSCPLKPPFGQKSIMDHGGPKEAEEVQVADDCTEATKEINFWIKSF